MAEGVDHPDLLNLVGLGSQELVHDGDEALFGKAKSVSEDEDLGVGVPGSTLGNQALHNQDAALAQLLRVGASSDKGSVETRGRLHLDGHKVASINGAGILRENLVSAREQLRERLAASERSRVGGARVGDGHGEAAAVEVGTVARTSRVLRGRWVDRKVVETLSSHVSCLKVDGGKAGAEASVDLLRGLHDV